MTALPDQHQPELSTVVSRVTACRVCGGQKPATEAYFYRRPSGDFHRECKDCFKRLKNERYRRDPEHARKVARESYHRVDGAAAKRRARSAKPELYIGIAARYESAHLTERHEKRVARHQANLDADRAAGRDWYHANRKRAIATALRWIREHPEQAQANTEKTRARRAQAPGQLTTAEWEAKRTLYQGRCAYCGRLSQSLEMDHVVPLACGGAHALDNVVPACRPCNRSKGGKLVADWREDRRRRGEPLPLDPDATLAAIQSVQLELAEGAR